ncbi:hypothetical protein ACQEXU_14295 [Vibrio sp. TRT 21S02]|uniref:hypothetical protein n=1 Tax=unclassified Vibrio TaxID=2614977 RepID=UPI003CEAA7B2
MNKSRVLGVLVALTSVVGLIFLLSAGSPLPVIQWPTEALNGLAFSFAWGFGLSKYLAYSVSVLFFIVIAVAGYFVGTKLAKCPFC